MFFFVDFDVLNMEEDDDRVSFLFQEGHFLPP